MPALATPAATPQPPARLPAGASRLLWGTWPWWAESTALVLLTLLVVGPARLADPELALGRPTRDLFDHIALLDRWSLSAPDWAFPSGGVLMPPDLSGMVLAAPILGWGLPRALTAAVWAQLTLSALAGQALGRRYGSGLVGGVAFGLSPYLIGQALSGETETVAAWPLPLMLLALERGGWRGWVVGGLMAGVAAVASWYHGAFAAVVLAGWLLFRGGLWAAGRQPLSRGVLLAPLVAGLVVAAPAAIYGRILAAPDQLFRGPTMARYLEEHPRALAAMSADLGAILGTPVPGVEHVDFSGYTVALLAALGAARLWRAERRRALWWLGLVAGAVILALGPMIHLSGSVLSSWAPYQLLAGIPPLGLMRLPHRWLLVATLGLSVLAAVGARGLPGWLVAGMILGETALFVVPERPATRIVVPAVVAQIDRPVLDLPARTLADDTRGRFLVAQRAHRQPTPYALLMKGWSEEVGAEPLVLAVAALDRRNRAPERVAEAGQFRKEAFAKAVRYRRQVGVDDTLLRDAPARLRGLGLGLVVLHRDLLDEDDVEPITELLTAHLGEPAWADADALLWRLEAP